LPSASVVAASENQAVAVLQGIGAHLRGVLPQMRQSALHDVERGRRLEVEETLGYTLRRAAEVGLTMPTIEVCYELLSGLNDFLG
jgi:ketopantoate reductase